MCGTAMEEDLQGYQDHLKLIEPSIKFTSYLESEGKLAFLDTETNHHEDGSMTTTVYRIKTHTDKYLAFESRHPMTHKNAVARTRFKRAEVICSSKLLERYPSSVIVNCLDHHRRKVNQQLM